MSDSFEAKLATIAQGRVLIEDDGEPAEAGQAPIRITFADATTLEAGYWRLITGGKATPWSSFDDRKQYGLPAPIDARQLLRKELSDHPCAGVRLDRMTGDLLLDFGECRCLQVLNFTGLEIWEVTFPDGTGEYSNFALQS